MSHKYLSLGDQAITIEFGTEINESVSARVLALHASLKDALSGGLMPGIVESIPTFRSLTVCFDPLILLPDEVSALVEPLINASMRVDYPNTHWQIPCCYEPEFGEDLDEVSKSVQLSRNDVIRVHNTKTYQVLMLGFLPGFGFMGSIDERLHLPRRKEPRVAVPKGSVAIANQLTAVYPSRSPGGWHLIGRTPIELFDVSRRAPFLLSAGDSVSFQQISSQEFRVISKAMDNKAFDVRSECQISGIG